MTKRNITDDSSDSSPGFGLHAAALAFYSAILLTSLLMPFDLYSSNHVEWNFDGLRFTGQGIVRSVAQPSRLHRQLVSSGRLSIELWVKSENPNQGGPARIVSYSKGPLRRNFTIGQEKSNLLIRLRTSRNNLNATAPQLIVQQVFEEPRFRHIVVTFDGVHVRVYVDSVLRLVTSRLGGDFANWDSEHSLLLGSEYDGTRPWRGVISSFGIYDRSLTAKEVMELGGNEMYGDTIGVTGAVALYRFGNGATRILDMSGSAPPIDLEVPHVIEPVGRPFNISAPTVSDFVVNLLIFVPLGYFAATMLYRSGNGRLWAALLAGGLGITLSLSAEFLQHYLVSRYSEVSDLILNTVGTGLGVCLASFRWRRRNERG